MANFLRDLGIFRRPRKGASSSSERSASFAQHIDRNILLPVNINVAIRALEGCSKPPLVNLLPATQEQSFRLQQ